MNALSYCANSPLTNGHITKAPAILGLYSSSAFGSVSACSSLAESTIFPTSDVDGKVLKEIKNLDQALSESRVADLHEVV